MLGDPPGEQWKFGSDNLTQVSGTLNTHEPSKKEGYVGEWTQIPQAQPSLTLSPDQAVIKHTLG